MKILIVGIKWPPETFIANLIRGLANKGISVIAAVNSKPDVSWLSNQNFHWIYSPHWEGFFLWRMIRLTRFFLRSVFVAPKDFLRFHIFAMKETKKIRNYLAIMNRLLPFSGRWRNVIYFPWNSAAINYRPLLDLGCPVIISCRGAQVNVAPHNPDRSQISKGLAKTFELAARVHCVSKAICKEAFLYGLTENKSVVITPAVNTDFFTPLTNKQNNFSIKIITTGSLIWRKGLEYSLMSIRKLIDQEIDAQYEIIGDGPERQRVLYTIQDLGLQKNVTLLGRLSPEEVKNRLQQADIFLLSSLSEGISNAVLEAMACGLPIVTTDCGGMREAVTDGVEGFVIPARDPDAMADRIKRLAESSELRSKMGQAARARAEKDFKLEEQIRRFVKLFEEAEAVRRL